MGSTSAGGAAEGSQWQALRAATGSITHKSPSPGRAIECTAANLNWHWLMNALNGHIDGVLLSPHPGLYGLESMAQWRREALATGYLQPAPPALVDRCIWKSLVTSFKNQTDALLRIRVPFESYQWVNDDVSPWRFTLFEFDG